MRKVFLMICCIVVTVFFLTACEETEVQKSSKEFDYAKALKLLHEQFPEFRTTNQNARTQALDLSCNLTSKHKQGSHFELSAKVNKTACYLNGDKFTTYWLYYNENTEVWKDWATLSGACIANGNTKGSYTVTADTTKIWFYAFVYTSFQNQNTLWGEGFSNGVVLYKP